MIVFTVSLFFSIMLCEAQQVHGPEAVLEFLGTDVPEDADPYEIERLEDLLAHPVRINSGQEVLSSCGLFTAYQAASLSDYISRHGGVFSLNELAVVDGFSEDYARKLSPFISMEGAELSGTASRGLRGDLTLRTAARLDGDESFQWSYGMRCLMTCGESFGLSCGLSRSYSAPSGTPQYRALSAEWRAYRFPLAVVLGDFNARFGQGLALWNGMSMGGVPLPSSIARRQSGISRSRSFTGNGALTGIAAAATLGRFSLSALVAMPGIKTIRSAPGKLSLLPGVNVTWNPRYGRLGFTHYADFSGIAGPGPVRIPDMKTSVDGSFCIRGTDIFAEAAFDWVNGCTAALAGTSFQAGEDMRLAAMLRYYPAHYSAERSGAVRSTSRCTNEYSASFCGEFSCGGSVRLRGQEGFGTTVSRHSGDFSFDLAFFPEPKAASQLHSLQVKSVCRWQTMLTDALRLGFRLSGCLRSWGHAWRTDFRTDLAWCSRCWNASMRLNALKCAGWGFLGYMEGGYKAPDIGIYFRQGLFLIDSWDDRIYVYERDAPGCFNVPAFYGRGVWTSFVASWRFARWGKLYARASCTAWPFMSGTKKKPGRAELKIQCVFSI